MFITQREDNMTKTALDRYLLTRKGTELLSNHSLDETGVWTVFGEEPDGDMYGNNRRPFIGCYRGSLRDVLVYVTSHDLFWSWGGGGVVRRGGGGKYRAKTIPQKVSDAKKAV
jgi:hypothetical protein